MRWAEPMRHAGARQLRSVYRSAEGQRCVQDRCRRWLDGWTVPHARGHVSTGAGATQSARAAAPRGLEPFRSAGPQQAERATVRTVGIGARSGEIIFGGRD